MKKILVPGCKLELNEATSNKDKKAITYLSQIYDFDEDSNRVSIAMPYGEGRMVVLSMGMHYDAFFYSKASMYHSRVVVVDRYKSNNLYVAVVELETAPKRVQRRQFFRYVTAMPVMYTPLDSETAAMYEKHGRLPESVETEKLFNGQTIDISGGGMKFAGNGFKKGSKVYIQFDYMLGMVNHRLRAVAEIIDSVKPQGREDIFHNRVSFDKIKNDDREMLIRYIFEEERKRMQSERRS